MQPLFQIFAAALALIVSIVYGGAPSAGDCGPTSVSGVPGCWGTPVSRSCPLYFMSRR